MSAIIVLRHLVENEASLQEYFDGLQRLLIASEISKQHNYDFSFGLNLTLDHKPATHLKKQFGDSVQHDVPKEITCLYNPQRLGSGINYQQVLFSGTFSSKKPIVACADLDQFAIHTKKCLEDVFLLVEKMKQNNSVYAIGSRDVPVILAQHKRNSDLRIICELFMTLALGSDKLRITEHQPDATPAYADLGEIASGFYVINHNNAYAKEIVANLQKAAQNTSLNGFACEVLVANMALQKNSIATGYVSSLQNKFYHNLSAEEDLKRATKIICNETHYLGKTQARDSLISALNDKNANILSKYYSHEDVWFVKSLMIDALNS